MKDIRLVATGSSAFELAAEVNESLSGRKREFKLFPISFKELVEDTSLLEQTRLLSKFEGALSIVKASYFFRDDALTGFTLSSRCENGQFPMKCGRDDIVAELTASSRKR